MNDIIAAAKVIFKIDDDGMINLFKLEEEMITKLIDTYVVDVPEQITKEWVESLGHVEKVYGPEDYHASNGITLSISICLLGLIINRRMIKFNGLSFPVDENGNIDYTKPTQLTPRKS